jgi:hypothetical protein
MTIRARVIALLMLLVAGPAMAGDVSDADRGAIDTVIANQIAAFRQDDGAKAYAYASPTIQRLFPTPESFMAMVRQGYPQVYRPQKYNFAAIGEDQLGRPQQHVVIVGPDGKTYEAVYSMQRQPDGTWKIDGCVIAEIQGTNV